MAYVEMEFDVDDIDWSYESVHSCARTIDCILDSHETLKDVFAQKLKVERPDTRMLSRKAIAQSSVEDKRKFFDEIFSDLLPNELEMIKELITKYDK